LANALVLEGLTSLVYQPAGGSPGEVDKTQKKPLGHWIDQGPQQAGFDTACWKHRADSGTIRREFHVLYNRYYLCELLRHLGFSYQKAQFVSDHLDEAKRHTWRTQDFPQILKEAQAAGLGCCSEDEVSFPQWGSLSYTWARRGETPEVKNLRQAPKRTKVFWGD